MSHISTFLMTMSLHHRSVHNFEDNKDPHGTSFVRTKAQILRQRRKLRAQHDDALEIQRHPPARLQSQSRVRRRFLQLARSQYTCARKTDRISTQPASQSFSSAGFVQGNGQSTSASSGQGFSSQRPPSSNRNRAQPRIQVSSLLSSYHRRPYNYHLEVVQHPIKTAEFRNASLSRLPLTPPLVARLTVTDAHGNILTPAEELPFLVAHLSLFTENGLTRVDGEPRTTPSILYGKLVSSLDILEDLQGNPGLFFIFPDVSIRWQGRFRLRVSLMKVASPLSIDSSGHVTMAQSERFLAEVQTHPFEVVSQDQYTAVAPTRLTQAFIRQGSRMFSFLPQS